MSSPLPIDVSMYNQWFGTKPTKSNSKLVDGKRSKPEVEDVLVTDQTALVPEVTEYVMTTPETSKEEVETDEERRGRGIFAKLAIPVAAAVAVWAVIAKSAA